MQVLKREVNSMAISKINSSFFRSNKNSTNDQCDVGCQPLVKSIAWFSQMARDEKLNSNEVNDALSKLENFLDQKESEKAEVVAELQLAYAFQDVFEERRAELIESIVHKRQ